MSFKKIENINKSNIILEKRHLGNLISELSPKSSGVEEFLKTIKKNPKLIVFLGFKNYDRLEEYIYENGIREFNELKDEMDKFFTKKRKSN
jgi:hypothetical protein